MNKFELAIKEARERAQNPDSLTTVIITEAEVGAQDVFVTPKITNSDNQFFVVYPQFSEEAKKLYYDIKPFEKDFVLLKGRYFNYKTEPEAREKARDLRTTFKQMSYTIEYIYNGLQRDAEI